MSRFHARLQIARNTQDFYDSFLQVFDINASCGQNLNTAVVAILEGGMPTIEDMTRLHTAGSHMRGPHSFSYALSFLFLAMMNAHRCEAALTTEEIRACAILGRESLEEIRAFCVDLMAPTYHLNAQTGRVDGNATALSRGFGVA
jgi:hypothetical protein